MAAGIGIPIPKRASDAGCRRRALEHMLLVVVAGDVVGAPAPKQIFFSSQVLMGFRWFVAALQPWALALATRVGWAWLTDPLTTPGEWPGRGTCETPEAVGVGRTPREQIQGSRGLEGRGKVMGWGSTGWEGLSEGLT